MSSKLTRHTASSSDPCMFDCLEPRLLLSGTTYNASDYLLFVNGPEWTYNVNQNGQQATVVVEMNSSSSTSGTLDYRSSDSDVVAADSSFAQQTRSGVSGIYLTCQSILGYDIDISGLLFLPDTFTLGQSFKSSGTAQANIRGLDLNMTVSGSGKIGKWSKITVPAGQFMALQVDFSWTGQATLNDVDTIYGHVDRLTVKTTETDRFYFVPGVGIVKQVQKATGSISGLGSESASTTYLLTHALGVSGALPNLGISQVSYNAGSFDLTKPNTIQVTQTNVGSTGIASGNAYDVTAVLSTDQVWGNEDDIELATQSETRGIGIDSKLNLSLATAASQTLPSPGSYFLGVMIDSQQEVSEGSETDNLWWSSTANVVVADTVSLTANPAPTGEGSGAAGVYTLTRTGTASSLTVGFTLSGTAKHGAANDYVLMKNGSTLLDGKTVTFAPGENELEVHVIPIDDALVESSETVILTLASSKSKTYSINANAKAATVIIADNEPTVSVSLVDGDAGASEPAGAEQNTATYRIALDQPTTRHVEVSFDVKGTAKRGVDYVLQVAGETLTSKTVTIVQGDGYVDVVLVPLQDNLVESSETVILALKSNKNLYRLDASHASATATIMDNYHLDAIRSSATAATTDNESQVSFESLTGKTATVDATIIYTNNSSQDYSEKYSYTIYFGDEQFVMKNRGDIQCGTYTRLKTQDNTIRLTTIDGYWGKKDVFNLLFTSPTTATFIGTSSNRPMIGQFTLNASEGNYAPASLSGQTLSCNEHTIYLHDKTLVDYSFSPKETDYTYECFGNFGIIRVRDSRATKIMVVFTESKRGVLSMYAKTFSPWCSNERFQMYTTRAPIYTGSISSSGYQSVGISASCLTISPLLSPGSITRAGTTGTLTLSGTNSGYQSGTTGTTTVSGTILDVSALSVLK